MKLQHGDSIKLAPACRVHACRHMCRAHRTSHLELLSHLERKASVTDLLTPVASLVRVADHRPLVSMGVKTRVDMQSNVLIVWADVHCETAAQC